MSKANRNGSLTGSVVSRDPAQDGRNWYDYAGNDPLGNADPSGNIPAGLLVRPGPGGLQVPSAPPGVSVRDNVARMLRIQARGGSPGISFAILVRQGGEWDYKRRGRRYEDFGNFNYGVVAAAMGYGVETACQLAGAVQVASGTSRPNWGRPWSGQGPYGDDPHDQHEIRLGYRYYNEVIQRRR